MTEMTRLNYLNGIEITEITGEDKLMTYSYEVDTGDVKTKILYKV